MFTKKTIQGKAKFELREVYFANSWDLTAIYIHEEQGVTFGVSGTYSARHVPEFAVVHCCLFYLLTHTCRNLDYYIVKNVSCRFCLIDPI